MRSFSRFSYAERNRRTPTRRYRRRRRRQIAFGLAVNLRPFGSRKRSVSHPPLPPPPHTRCPLRRPSGRAPPFFFSRITCGPPISNTRFRVYARCVGARTLASVRRTVPKHGFKTRARLAPRVFSRAFVPFRRPTRPPTIAEHPAPRRRPGRTRAARPSGDNDEPPPSWPSA